MDLRRLKQFVAVAEELHFGRAAAKLGLTQPPLSMAIRGLERELGVRLFERTRRSVALTPAGAVFLDEARALLARAASAADLARAAHRGEVGRLVVGYLAATAYTLMPVAVRDFVSRFPAVRLELREHTMGTQLEALQRGDIDVALMRPVPGQPAIAFETVMQEPMVVALPAAHSLARLARIPPKRLAPEGWVMFPRDPGTIFHDLIMGFCRTAGFAPRISQEASQTHAVLGLVSAGLGVALVAESSKLIGLKGVVLRPLQSLAPIVPTAVGYRLDDDSVLVREFVASVKQGARAAKRL